MAALTSGLARRHPRTGKHRNAPRAEVRQSDRRSFPGAVVGQGPQSGTSPQLLRKLSGIKEPPKKKIDEKDRKKLADKTTKKKFVGKQPQSEIRDYLSVADLFLLPSQSESFGLSALEAMACEVPVIATRVGGVPEVVEDGGCGYLFEIGDVNGMAEAALRLLNDEASHQHFGARGREIAITRFTTDEIIPQYEALYQKMVTSDR